MGQTGFPSMGPPPFRTEQNTPVTQHFLPLLLPRHRPPKGICLIRQTETENFLDFGAIQENSGRTAGAVSPKHDLDLTQALADKVSQVALCRPLLLAVDGLVCLIVGFHFSK